QGAHRSFAKHFESLVDGLKRVTNAAFAEELRLTEIRIPARATDPAAHHVTAPWHHVDLMRWRTRQKRKNFIARCVGAAFVGVEPEYPAKSAGRDGAIAQVAKPVERQLHDACASERAISAVRSVLNESTTTTSSAHNTLDPAASIFSASL